MEADAVNPGDLIAVSAIIVGFGLTVVMFRVQREIAVQETHPEWPNWLACSDYLIIGSVLLPLFFVIIPILVVPGMHFTSALSAASCVAAIFLQVGYIPSILAHYRIEIGTERAKAKLPRQRCEPAERLFVLLAGVLAMVGFVAVFCSEYR